MSWYEATTRWLDKNPFLVDLMTTAVLIAVTLLLTPAIPFDTLRMGVYPDAATLSILSVLVVAPLALRRRNPVASVVLVYSAVLIHLLLASSVLFPADLAVILALYSITVYGPRWAHLVAMGAGVAGCLLVCLIVWLSHNAPFESLVLISALVGSVLLATWAFALVRRGRLSTLTALRDHAKRLEIERDQQMVIATAAERSRIAREMHDIVAHSLSVMIAQADGGRYMAATDPAAAGRTLTTISETGRAALEDMRRLLGVLREPPAGRTSLPGSSPARTPQPAATDIESLVAQVRASGTEISLVRMGTPRTLPPGTGLTLFRICQEALTNILKHAGPNPAVTVVLTWGRNNVRLEVDDDGRGAAAGSDGAGQGLLGMRERAAMFGGTVVSGPRPGGGFRVMLDLPLPELHRSDPTSNPQS